MRALVTRSARPFVEGQIGGDDGLRKVSVYFPAKAFDQRSKLRSTSSKRLFGWASNHVTEHTIKVGFFGQVAAMISMSNALDNHFCRGDIFRPARAALLR